MKLIILGNSLFSRKLKYDIEHFTDDEVVAFSLDSPYISSDRFDGLPLVPFEELQRLFPPNDYQLLNTLGYKRMLATRRDFHWRAKALGYTLYTYKHPSNKLCSPVGEGSIVLDGVSIDFNCMLGIGGIYWSNARIGEACRVGDFTYWAPGSVGCGNLDIGDRCFIGANATLRDGISLAPMTLVGAGVYMNRSVKEPNKMFKSPYPVEGAKPAEEWCQ